METLEWIDAEQLERLTARKQKAAQIRVLNERKIPFLLDGDGRPLVLASDLVGNVRRRAREFDIDWTRMKGAAPTQARK